MSVKISIIFGRTGEYDSVSRWPVGAYYSREQAEQHANLAEKEAIKIAQERANDYSPAERDNPYDPDMRMDYTGTDYYVIDVNLLDAIPGVDG